MRSGGFGLGKKQARSEEPKRLPPTNADLTQLLSSSQKNPEKIFSLTWQARDSASCQYTLTVMNCGAQRDRRGWSSSAIDNSAIGEAEWKLSKEDNSLSQTVFSMRSSDSYLIHTLIEEASVTGGASSVATAMPAEVRARSEESSHPEQILPEPSNGPSQSTPKALEGSLRQTGVRALLESFQTNKTTGRLICDIGTVQSEVFLTDGEPVHAKSCHSISQGRDTVGDAALIDLLTWKDGTYKFQEGWPAASKSISSPLDMFLAGSVPVPEPTVAASPATSPGASAQAPSEPKVSRQAAVDQTPANAAAPDFTAGPSDDFSQVDDLIGAMYSHLVEPSGLLRYGMFLMLVRSEFVRLEKVKTPFCFASIGMELPNGAQISDAALSKIAERFEKVCQPLDTLTYAGNSRFFALFPQSETPQAATVLKQFMNNVVAIPLDTGLHGSAVKMTVGVSEAPRDGSEFQQIFRRAGGLRGQATPDKKMVTSSF